MSTFRLKHDLMTSLWFIPLLFMLGAGAVHAIAITLDPRGELVPQSVSGDPDAAGQILYLISFAMLTLTGLVLSLVVVVVQLAMGSSSPRIVRQILQDRPSQCAIGLFAGTFIHAILTLRVVRTTADPSVPGLAVLIALVTVIACMATLVWYVNHIGQSLRAAALVEWVARDTVKALDHVYPPEKTPPPPEDVIIARVGGMVFMVDHVRLVRLAEQAGCMLEVLWSVGDYVPQGAALIRIHGPAGGVNRRRVSSAVTLGPERTLNQDVAFGLRMLVDIAERTVSSSPFEDPTTAVQAIDRIHEVMRQIAPRPLSDGCHRGQDGTLRLVVPTMRWEGYVRIAFDELRRAGAGSPQVVRRLRFALQDLLVLAPEDRRPPLRQQLELLEQVADQLAPTAADRAAAQVPDASGLGSSDDLTTQPPTALPTADDGTASRRSRG